MSENELTFYELSGAEDLGLLLNKLGDGNSSEYTKTNRWNVQTIPTESASSFSKEEILSEIQKIQEKLQAIETKLPLLEQILTEIELLKANAVLSQQSKETSPSIKERLKSIKNRSDTI